MAITPNNRYNPGYRGQRKKNDHGFIINENITASEVRLTGDLVESQVMTLTEALAKAASLSLDLVEINAQANPPVVRVVDFQKFLYEKKKKEKEIKQAQKTVVTKEVRLGPHIADHDLNFKTNDANRFLKQGNKVKALIRFRGREMSFKDKGEIILLKFIQSLEEVGKPEFLPKMEGNVMYVVLTPKKIK